MAEKSEVDTLRESAEDLVTYVQGYQERLAQAQFQLVQCETREAKANRRLAEVQEELIRSRQRIAELEAATNAESEDLDKPLDVA